MSLPVLHDEEELMARTSHLFTTASEISCAARDLNTWAATHAAAPARTTPPAGPVRKLYRSATLLSPSMAEHVRMTASLGAEVRITEDDLNETIIFDRRFAILAGDARDGRRSYTFVTEPAVVQNVLSLFNAAWRKGTDLVTYNAQNAELASLAPKVLDLLSSGCKDETAARTLGLGVRTYRRRVAELMTALGATSRFQAGLRARDLGLL
jgi:DNA-binding NarL/FixJ family response regulator